MIFSLCKQFIRLSEDLYIVEKTLPDREGLDIEILKKFYGAEIVLRRDQTLYLVNKIETLEYESIGST
jgi:hypothetical protein